MSPSVFFEIAQVLLGIAPHVRKAARHGSRSRLIVPNPHGALILAVFVTGNANKLAEVKAILAAGGAPLALESRALDRMIYMQ